MKDTGVFIQRTNRCATSFTWPELTHLGIRIYKSGTSSKFVVLLFPDHRERKKLSQ